MLDKKKQKRIRKMLDSGQCPCQTCSSQDVKREGDDDFEISDNIDSHDKRESLAETLGQELPILTEDLIVNGN